MGKKKAGAVLVVTVDGKAYPLDPGALSARDEDRLRAVSASSLTLTAVMQSLSSGAGGLSDIAAFCYLSELQRGLAPKWDDVAGAVRLDSDVQFSDGDLDDPE